MRSVRGYWCQSRPRRIEYLKTLKSKAKRWARQEGVVVKGSERGIGTGNQVYFQGGDILSTTFIFILHVREHAYLSIASIYKGVKTELEHQNIYRRSR